MKKLGLFLVLALLLALLLGVVLGTCSPARAEGEEVVADEVITLKQGETWSPECGIVRECGENHGTPFGEHLGEAIVGLLPEGIVASTINYGYEWGYLDAATIIAANQMSHPLDPLIGWVVHGIDIFGRPWKAQVLDIGGEQIVLHIIVYPSVIGISDSAHDEVDGVVRWAWLVGIPSENFWGRLGIGGEIHIGEFSLPFDFEPSVVEGEILASRVRNPTTPTPWKITFQEQILFVGTTLGPERWAHQIYLPLAVK